MSELRQAEEDQEHMISLIGGMETYTQLNSFTKQKPTHGLSTETKGYRKRKVMRRCKFGGSQEHIDSKIPINLYIKQALDKDYCTTPGPLLNVLQ